ncbi:MAG: nitrilase [Actinomycetota bacterium]|nr:nitrilase [Actinomycetota bacterium]
MPNTTYTAAVIQRPPVLLDRGASMAKVLEGVEEAASSGARLVVFPETYLPGYPEYIWRLRPGDDYDISREIHGKLIAGSVDIGAGDLRPIQDAARRSGTTVSIGVHERDGSFSRGTLYNTVVLIDAEGAIRNRHRKLVPTNPERMVWAPGDAAGLRVTDTPLGRIGGLICWENYMPLARFALYAQGIDVWVAPTWDEGDAWIASMRHIAQEGRCWVIGAGCAIRASDVPADFPRRDELYPDPDEWLNPGDSVIVSPSGEIVAGPLREAYGILTAEIDPVAARTAHYTLDVAGHYNRPDIFSLRVDRSPRPQVAFEEPEAASAPAVSAPDVIEL